MRCNLMHFDGISEIGLLILNELLGVYLAKMAIFLFN